MRLSDSTTSGGSAQLLGMWLLLVDIFTAGPLGPTPKLFAAGVAVFLAGWAPHERAGLRNLDARRA